MIDKLISSYRAQIYDWGIGQWCSLIKERWKPIAVSLAFLLFPVGMFLLGAARKSAVIMLLSLFVEGIPLAFFDRYMVRYHAIFLQNRQNRLKETEKFLKEVVPDVNLYRKDIIDELIRRLSERIDQRVPFKNFLNSIGRFAKAIILPVITYVAGVYSGGLEEVTIEVVATYAVFIILLLGILRLAWAGFSDIAKTFFCRDYDAAIAFREDLLDLRLLYFQTNNDVPKND